MSIPMTDVDILLVEDNDGDVRLVEWAFDTRELPGTLHVVQTGAGALDWLNQRGEYAEKPRPDLVLLDLNLPATSGHDIIDELKSDVRLRQTPVIVLTSSQAQEDVVKAYEKYANACLRKPVEPNEFADLIQTFVEFWVSAAVLPAARDDTEPSEED